MFNGFGDLIQQAQKVREEMASLQEALAGKSIEVTSAGGKIKITINGKQQILAVSIAPELAQQADKAALENALLAGVNAALQASQAMVSREMSQRAGSLGPLKGLLGLS